MNVLLKLWTCCGGLIAELVTLTGVAVGGIGITGMVGYVLENRGLYSWFPAGAPMAFPTCLAFCMTGTAIILLSYRVSRIEQHIHAAHE